MKSRKISDAISQYIIAEYQQGRTAASIAEELNVSGAAISYQLKKAGIRARQEKQVCIGNERRISNLSRAERQEITRRYLAGESTVQLGRELGVKHTLLCQMLRRMGITLRGRQKSLSEEQRQEVGVAYQAGSDLQQLAERYRCSMTTISQTLKAIGVKTRSQEDLQRKYPLDTMCFNKINNEHAAYFYGFLLADGYNNTETGHVRVRLQACDVDILEKFRAFLKTNRPLYLNPPKKATHSPHITLDIGSRRISAALEKWGCTKAKTHTVAFPRWLDSKLYHHFVRGYFDGDGHFGYTERDNRARFSIVGTRSLCESIADILQGFLEVRAVIRHNHCNPNNNICELKISGKRNIYKVMEWLYNDANVWLNRKRERYEDAKTRFPVSDNVYAETCSVCDAPHFSKGYCKPHWRRFLAHGDPLAGRPLYRPSPICVECGEPTFARSLCHEHYKAWRNALYAAKHDVRPKYPKQCIECGEQAIARGYCDKHYNIFIRRPKRITR